MLTEPAVVTWCVVGVSALEVTPSGKCRCMVDLVWMKIEVIVGTLKSVVRVIAQVGLFVWRGVVRRRLNLWIGECDKM